MATWPPGGWPHPDQVVRVDAGAPWGGPLARLAAPATPHVRAQCLRRTPLPGPLLRPLHGATQVAALLTAAFYDDDDAWQRGTAVGKEPPMAGFLFGWASLLAVLLQHQIHGGRYVTLLASLDDQVVGCCGITFEAAPADVTTAAGSPPDSEYALLTGLAVDPGHRRRGVATELLAAAAAVAAARLAPPSMVALLVARTNTAALRLYARQGYEEQPSWTDVRWLDEAERGKVGKPRRLLLVKRLPA